LAGLPLKFNPLIDMENYLTEKVREARPLGGHRLALTFEDGFAAEFDLAPIIEAWPAFERLRDETAFRSVTVSYGVPEWGDDLDLSPGTLRVWCEAGRVLTMEETDEWIARHSEPARRLA